MDFGDWDKDTVTRKEQVDYIDVKVDCTLQLLSLGALCENLEKHGRRDSSRALRSDADELFRWECFARSIAGRLCDAVGGTMAAP